MSEERRLARKASRRRSPTPTSMLPDEPSAPKTTEDIATAGKVVVGLSTNNQEHEEVAALGELMDAEAVTEAVGSLDKMSGWPEGGIASAGNIVDNMSGCVRARLKWYPRS